MRVSILIVALSYGLLCSANFEGISSASFEGEGIWRDNQGNSGDYSIAVEFSTNDSKTMYRWEAKEIEQEFYFHFYRVGLFNVLFEGEIVGSGFCMVDQCHYEMNFGVEVIETITFLGSTLKKIGYKTMDEHTIRWEETLEKINLRNQK